MTNSWRLLQGAKCASSNWTQLKVLELGSKQCLNVLGITGEEEPIPCEVGLVCQGGPTLLQRDGIEAVLEEGAQSASIVGLDEADYIDDAQRVRTGKCRHGFTAESFGGCSMSIACRDG